MEISQLYLFRQAHQEFAVDILHLCEGACKMVSLHTVFCIDKIVCLDTELIFQMKYNLTLHCILLGFTGGCNWGGMLIEILNDWFASE